MQRKRCHSPIVVKIDSMDVPGWGEGQTINHKTALQLVITWLEARMAGVKGR